jgi:hypothetical protein
MVVARPPPENDRFGDDQMLRKTACAAVGITLACAAGVSLSLLAQSQNPSDLDLRWLHTSSAKEDRLPFDQTNDRTGVVLTFDLPAEAMSIVTRESTAGIPESAVRTPRPESVRSAPAVRQVPEEKIKKDRLPVGCEPAFSPVTTPAFAHIGVRCDS